ncbi:MAG: transposase [Planctomycetota bacterium]|jgi:REP element-mobilizing transposase RayT
MGRRRRLRVNQDFGSYHVVSRLSDGLPWWSDEEKEEFMRLLERLARGVYVQIHAFCFMSNHFHLLLTGQEREAAEASKEELLKRYRAIHGKRSEPPPGELQNDGSWDHDHDGGIERLRERLGDVSRFVQELKQTFARSYNRRRGRKGTIWYDRFKSVLTSKEGDAEVVQAAYIELNPIRAEMVRVPEDYRWSSAGLRVRSPHRAKRLLTRLDYPELKRNGDAWFRMFTYIAGAIPVRGKRGFISTADAEAMIARQGRLGVLGALRYRCRNLSEGVAVGSAKFVAAIQRRRNQKNIAPRPFLDPLSGAGPPGPVDALCATRVLRSVD